MSYLKELLCCLTVLCVSVLPVLPQHCDQFNIQPPVGPDMPLVLPVGGSQRLTCSHGIRPAIALQWVRDVTIIRESNPDTVNECSCQVPSIDSNPLATEKELIFTNFAASSAGQYSCRAPDVIGSGVFNICRFDVSVAEAPSFQVPQPPSNHTVNLGNTLMIPVTVEGVPTPTITWRNSSTQLIDGGRVDISDTGSLTVTEIASYDRGNYSLNLTNIGGNLIRYFSVFVPFVEITSISNPRTENNQIFVTCEAVGYPQLFVEWQDSSENVISTIFETIIDPGTYETTRRVTLMVSQEDCQGRYTCIARNRNGGAIIERQMSVDVCDEPPPSLPRPTITRISQNGVGSVRVDWTVENSDVDFVFDVCYSQSSVNEICLSNGGSRLSKTTMSTTITGLRVGVTYTFIVYSVNSDGRVESTGMDWEVIQCLGGELSVQVYGVSVNTAVNDGERTFNISWREASNNVVSGYKVMETKTRWEQMVTERFTTNFITPANFCNGEDHRFVVMAFGGNCEERGPPSSEVIAKCDSAGRIKITDVRPYGNAIEVSWALKDSISSSSISIQSLSITVLEIQPDGNSQQLKLNYSKSNTNEYSECLGGLKLSTVYKICLHPIYSDRLTEIVPVCMDTTTKNSNNNDPNSDECSQPVVTEKLPAIEQAVLPDYAIAVIVIGALILLAVVFCGIGVCFACSNSKSKDIDDMGSEYSSSIAAGMGMQGRMPSNHNRNMSPTRSCLSYHSKGHSTNWQDHMGTLREMETEVGTNV